MTTLSRVAVREFDRRAIDEYGVPGVVLMENAGRNVADFIWTEGGGRPNPTVICCGPGNNGGDGFVIARHLDRRGADVRIMLFARPDALTGDAAAMYQIVSRARVPIVVAPADPSNTWLDEQPALDRPGFKVDALFGTGWQGPLRPPFDRIVEAINGRKFGTVVAVDIPSGLDCDTGEPLGPTVKAAHTVTFVAQKAGFTNPKAKEWLGEVHVVDIGAPRALLGQYGIR